jgi:hypothetical protein
MDIKEVIPPKTDALSTGKLQRIERRLCDGYVPFLQRFRLDLGNTSAADCFLTTTFTPAAA